MGSFRFAQFTQVHSVHSGSLKITWDHSSALGFTLFHFGSVEFKRVHPGLLGFTGVYLGSLGLTWVHLRSLGFTWVHFVSLGFNWLHLGSIGFSQDHSNSLRFTPAQPLGSLRFTCFYLGLFGFIQVCSVHSGALSSFWFTQDYLGSLECTRFYIVSFWVS